MSSTAAALTRRYAFVDGAVDSFTEAFEPSHWRHRGDGRSNHALWILGHLAQTRRWIASALLGVEMPDDLAAHFSRGAEPGRAVDDLDPAELRAAFLDAGRVVRERLESMGDDELAAPLPDGVAPPDGSTTLGEALDFLAFHEGMHVGQIGLLRRCSGKDGLF